MTTAPKVSIGFPVFNGENYLREALDSILAQTYRDFELIISDNASTDTTAEICGEYVSRDSRVAYYRNDQNIGPDLNFNRTVDLASGSYFKWAAHDDLLEPTFIEKCVTVLDAEPDVILCHSLTRIIDEENRELAVYDSGLRGARSPRQSKRFASLILRQHVCSDMFGLMRIDALRRSRRLEGNYHGCDRAMLAELALIGRFAQIPEPLFLNREHRARSVRAVKPSERSAQRNMVKRARIGLNTLNLYCDYWRALVKHTQTTADRTRGAMHLLTWWFVSWNSLRVSTELVAQVYPGFYDFAKHKKGQYVQPAHPLVSADSNQDD